VAEEKERPGKGGKKFQERLPGEKRTRKNEVKTERKSTGYGAGPRKPYTPREGDDRGTDRKRSFGNDREGGTRKPYTRREGDDRGTDRKRSFGNDRDAGTRKPYTRREGDDRGTDRKRSIGNDRDAGTRKPYTRREGDDRTTTERKRSFGDEGASRTRKPANSKTEAPVSRGRKVATDEKPLRKTRGKQESAHEPAPNFKGRGKEFRKTAEQRDKEENLASGLIRLNRFIAMSGKHSRREADTMISEGRVSVNNEVVTELGTHVGPEDVVKLDNHRIRAQKPVYILLNKPKGYVTTTDDQDGRATVMDLINLPGSENLFPVGRLDRNTTGVLLITNDGELAQRLMHPSFEIKKIYRAKLDRKPSKDHMLAWIEGVELEDGRMSFEQVGFVEKNDPNVLGVEIKSGRNRIVRRMFEHYGYEVKSLDRVMLGEFDKVNLGRGRWRFLNDKELRVVEKLKAAGKKKR
jgi:23S rRNA pseudouridine2605 synthase